MQEGAMIDGQQSPAAEWRLAPGEACSWRAPGPHVLQVVEGRLWLARTRHGERAAEDVVLAAGEALRLDAGDRLVLEGWPQARFEFKLAPEGRPGAGRPRKAPPAGGAVSWSGWAGRPGFSAP